MSHHRTRGIEDYAERAASFGWRLGGPPDQSADVAEAPPGAHSGALEQCVAGRAVTVCLEDVEPVRVAWLWAGHIPLGRLTILDGDPGLGKSTVTLDLAARVTTGRAMPDGSQALDGARGVVLLGAEDGLADTVRPRLDAAGADAARLVALTGVRDLSTEDEGARVRLPTVYDVDAIADAAEQVDAVLLIVDPLAAYMAGADTHRDADVRQALADLAGFAERTGLAVLAVRHLTKGGGGNPIYRGGGSIAFIAAARSGMLLARDPEHEGQVVLARTKGNLAPPWPSLALRVFAHEDVARVDWLGESEQSAADLLSEAANPEAHTALEDAMELLRVELHDGPQPARQVKRDAGTQGIADMTLRRARKRLGVVVKRVGFGREGEWQWSLPDHAAIDVRSEGTSIGPARPSTYEKQVAPPRLSDAAVPIDAQTQSVNTYGIKELPHHYCAAGCGTVVGRAGVTCAMCLYGSRADPTGDALEVK